LRAGTLRNSKNALHRKGNRVAQSSDLQRERFWQDLICRFDYRLRAYLRRARWSPEQIEELIWDVWGVAVELEESLVDARDQWPILRRLAAQLSARRLRVRRRELSLGDNVAQPSRSNPIEESAGDAFARRTWIEDALARLSEKQRLAVDYRYRWGWPYWAVAAAVGTAEPTARVHAKRGLDRLREMVRMMPQSHSREHR
jgi:RNA polymerase sigma factor (sigma-70 family)